MTAVNFSPRKRADMITVTTGYNEQRGATVDALPEEYAMDWVKKAQLPRMPTKIQAIRSLYVICHENDGEKIKRTVIMSVTESTIIVTKSLDTWLVDDLINNCAVPAANRPNNEKSIHEDWLVFQRGPERS